MSNQWPFTCSVNNSDEMGATWEVVLLPSKTTAGHTACSVKGVLGTLIDFTKDDLGKTNLII